MLCDVLALADEHVQLPASDGGTCSLSASVRDMAAYSKLTDSIFKYLLQTSSHHNPPILKFVEFIDYLTFSVYKCLCLCHILYIV
jgi:hypothetical protein